MADEDYMLVPVDVRRQYEDRCKRPDGEIDWAGVEKLVRAYYPEVIGQYDKLIRGGV